MPKSPRSPRPQRSPNEPRSELSAAARKARMAALVRQARRAGRIVIGVRLNKAAAREGRVAAVLVAEDLAAARRDTLSESWRAQGLPVYRGWSKDELGELAGRPAVAVLGVSDRNIAAGLAQIEAVPAEDPGNRREE